MHSYDFQAVVGSDETILWQGRPNKKCFILESIFNPLLPFAILWTVIDLGGIGFGLVPNVVKHEIETGVLIYLTVFFLFHMMPVWIYGAGVVLAFRNYHFNER